MATSTQTAVRENVKAQNPALITPAPVAPTPVAPVASLATADGKTQAEAIIEALSGAYVKVAAAALSETSGNAETAAQLVGIAVVPTLHKIARIVPILRNSAPAALFTDGNNRGARVGELFASRLGLAAKYRDVSRANLKDARAALVESAK